MKNQHFDPSFFKRQSPCEGQMRDQFALSYRAQQYVRGSSVTSEQMYPTINYKKIRKWLLVKIVPGEHKLPLTACFGGQKLTDYMVLPLQMTLTTRRIA